MESPSSDRRHGIRGRREPGPLGCLIPGLPQWAWRQRERALVLSGSFLTSLLVTLFVWGTKASWLILAFAFGTHVISVADVIRQRAFPGFGRWVPVWSASAGLGLACYGPLVSLALICAWPGGAGDITSEGYLINRGAYWTRDPVTGQSAWARLPGWRAPRLVRVLAGPGQGVEWSESGLRVDGQGVAWAPAALASRPRELSFTVPQGEVLVALEPTERSPGLTETSCGLVLVSKSQIGGRAWARMYPIWERGLIP
jgi:hypothetical protein